MLGEPLRGVDQWWYAKTAADEDVVGVFLEVEAAAERAEHVHGVAGLQLCQLFGAVTHYGEDHANLITVDLADTERTRHEHEVVVREQIDELGGLGVGDDERVAERQSHHAVGQFRNLCDFNVVTRREESGRSRLRNHIMSGGESCHVVPIQHLRCSRWRELAREARLRVVFYDHDWPPPVGFADSPRQRGREYTRLLTGIRQPADYRACRVPPGVRCPPPSQAPRRRSWIRSICRSSSTRR